MSWSISAFGKPENVVNYIEAQRDKHSGQSRIEYEDAVPHLVALVRNNFLTDEYKTLYPHSTLPHIKLEANGSGTARGDDQLQRSCNVKIETIWVNCV